MMIKDEVIEMLEGLQRSGVKISGFENLLKNSGKGFRLEPMSKPDDKEVSEEEERKWTFFDKSKPHTISNDATNVTLNLYSKQTKTKNVETMHLAFTKDAFKEIGKLKYVQVAIDKKSRMIGFFKSDEEHGYKVSIHNGTNAQIDIGSRVLVLELKKLLGSGRRALKAVLEYDKKEDCYYIVVPEEK